MPTDSDSEFDPDEIVRFHDGWKYFGLKDSRLKAKIDAGEIEAPIPLSPSGRATGWTRRTIRNHHIKMAALAEQRKQEAGPKIKQPQPEALVRKIKKIKIRPPGNHPKQQSAR